MNKHAKLVERLGEAITAALQDDDKIIEAVEAIRENDLEIVTLALEITVQGMRYKLPVPVAASVNWLEHLHKLKDKRESQM